jgi:hypothetical protein
MRTVYVVLFYVFTLIYARLLKTANAQESRWMFDALVPDCHR